MRFARRCRLFFAFCDAVFPGEKQGKNTAGTPFFWQTERGRGSLRGLFYDSLRQRQSLAFLLFLVFWVF